LILYSRIPPGLCHNTLVEANREEGHTGFGK
jgi:hypothetical protein